MKMGSGVLAQRLHGLGCVMTTENTCSHSVLAGFNRTKVHRLAVWLDFRELEGIVRGRLGTALIFQYIISPTRDTPRLPFFCNGGLVFVVAVTKQASYIKFVSV